jgi:hypothetical protein
MAECSPAILNLKFIYPMRRRRLIFPPNLTPVIPTKVGIQPKNNPRSEQNRCGLATRGSFKRLDTDFRRYDDDEVFELRMADCSPLGLIRLPLFDIVARPIKRHIQLKEKPCLAFLSAMRTLTISLFLARKGAGLRI